MANKEDIKMKILASPIYVINWSSNGCMPCKNQFDDLSDIKSDLDTDLIHVANVNYKDYLKEFKKFNNKVFPSLNVFVNGKSMTFIDSKLGSTKKISAISGRRDKETLMKIMKSALEKL